LEIKETAVLSEEAIAMSNLAELRSMGVKVVLDDFGTGFSSLTHLVQLPISGVKIDRAVVARVVEDDRTAAVVSGLSALVQRLGLSLTAEGVESEPQLRFLVANGCEDFQGYLVSPAVAPEVFVKWIEYQRSAA
jgi:EAL domain-containing protein (putative c-di-GMP-specific phosphodiesterase class I)